MSQVAGKKSWKRTKPPQYEQQTKVVDQDDFYLKMPKPAYENEPEDMTKLLAWSYQKEWQEHNSKWHSSHQTTRLQPPAAAERATSQSTQQSAVRNRNSAIKMATTEYRENIANNKNFLDRRQLEQKKLEKLCDKPKNTGQQKEANSDNKMEKDLFKMKRFENIPAKISTRRTKSSSKLEVAKIKSRLPGTDWRGDGEVRPDAVQRTMSVGRDEIGSRPGTGQSQMGLRKDEIGARPGTGQSEMGLDRAEIGNRPGTGQSLMGRSRDEIVSRPGTGQNQMGRSRDEIGNRPSTGQSLMGRSRDEIGNRPSTGQSLMGRSRDEIGNRPGTGQSLMGLDRGQIQNRPGTGQSQMSIERMELKNRVGSEQNRMRLEREEMGSRSSTAHSQMDLEMANEGRGPADANTPNGLAELEKTFAKTATISNQDKDNIPEMSGSGQPIGLVRFESPMRANNKRE